MECAEGSLLFHPLVGLQNVGVELRASDPGIHEEGNDIRLGLARERRQQHPYRSSVSYELAGRSCN